MYRLLLIIISFSVVAVNSRYGGNPGRSERYVQPTITMIGLREYGIASIFNSCNVFHVHSVIDVHV